MRRLRTFAIRHFEGFLLALIIIGVLVIAGLVQYKFSFLNFFFLPVILAGYFLGKKKAVLIAVLSILLIFLYLIYQRLLAGMTSPFSFDEVFNLAAWGGFLVLTGAIVGTLVEQRETKLNDLKQAYIGVLTILLRYLQVADEVKPRPLRVANLAGKIAQEMGLDTREIENIKAAALLYDMGDFGAGLSLYADVSEFMALESGPKPSLLPDRDKVLLQTSVSLLRDIAPILNHYYMHYVQESSLLDKNLDEINLSSSVIALADIYDRINHKVPLPKGLEEFSSLKDLQTLAGRVFPERTIQALNRVISLS